MIAELALTAVLLDDPIEEALAYADHVEHFVTQWEADLAADEEAQEAAQAARAADATDISRSAPRVADTSIWYRLASCESGQRWGYNGSSGFDGGLQFDPSTWAANAPADYPDFAYLATAEQQIAVAEDVLAASSWEQQWPTCSAELGLR